MKFAYKFNNLLGTVYKKGNILFTPDGNSVISPVGNRITIFDLKNNKTKTLCLENKLNYSAIDISPNGCLMVAANESGQAQMISLVSCTVIQTYKFSNIVNCIKFSPDGKYFAATKENMVFVFMTPGEINGQFNSFVVRRYYYCTHDNVTTLDWSYDSKLIAVGSKDNSTKIISVDILKHFYPYLLGGHSEPIVGCFFEFKTYDLITVSKNGQMCLWECSLTSDELIQIDKEDIEPLRKKRKETEKLEESDDDIDKNFEKLNVEPKGNDELNKDDDDIEKKNNEQIDSQKDSNKFSYKRIARHYLANEAKKENRTAQLTSATYHKKSKLLITAYTTGAFYLHEMPEVNLIHSLSITDYTIDSSCFNVTGDWIALASSGVGQLLVWEWQSEQYIMKQQGHFSEMNCICYSSDGEYIATGGEDSKIKLWNVQSGFCFVTFNEHTSAITSLQFSNSKKFLISSSLDGTVRGFDTTRYRNFRTFTTPEPVQFSSCALDSTDEFVAAGGQDVFEVYLWSMKFGRLLEVLSGHEGPVCSLAFSPSPTSSMLVSGSWDKTVRIWNCIETSGNSEVIEMLSDVMAIAFHPNGEEIAISTISGTISIFNVTTTQEVSSIEGRNDLEGGIAETDLISAKKNLRGKSFTSIAYSADGECLLAGGKSKNVCIYHVKQGTLLKKFVITQNQSFDGLNDYINYRKMTEFGNMALVEERDIYEGGNVKISLPGVQKGDMAARSFKPEVRVFCVRFSPTGQSWSAATTEGLLIYSLDKGIVFDPYQLSMEITPKATRNSIKQKDYSSALIMAMKLNETNLIHEIIEQIPSIDIKIVIRSLPDELQNRLLQFTSKLIGTSQHIEFYLNWTNELLTELGQKENILQQQSLLLTHQNLSQKYEMLNKICDFNKYTMKVIKEMASIEIEKEKKLNGNIKNGDDDDDGLIDASELDLLLIKENATNNDDDDDTVMSSEESSDDDDDDD